MTGFDHPGRVARLQVRMAEGGYDAAMFSVGADLRYFTGYEAMASERLTMFVIRSEGDPVMFVPRLEAPRVEEGAFDLVAWGETDDPVHLVAKAVAGSRRALIGDHTWSAFLLGLQAELADLAWEPASPVTKELRMRKDPAEIDALRAASHGADRVLARLPAEVRFEGRTESEVSADLRRMTVEEGHETAEFAIVASGPNSASPHHEPGDRVIRQGDLVVCDFGGRHDGYFSDVTRTFVVGEPTAEQTAVHDTVLTANSAGRAAVEPGVSCQGIDTAARTVINDAGFGEWFVHRTGHGIGLEVHEHPYLVEGNELSLEPGMTFSVEPGIYLPGRYGARVEDIVVCTEDGAEPLNQADRGLVVVA